MTIFYEVARKLISTTLAAAIAKSEADDADWTQINRNRKVSGKKQELLRMLLEALSSMPPPENDAQGLRKLQELLGTYQEQVVEVTTDPALTETELVGTTEKILGNLSDSLEPTFRQFNKLGLLEQQHDDHDALKQFHFLIGLYYAKVKFRAKEMPVEQGALAKYAADVAPFIKAQKKLVEAFFELCSEDIGSWDESKRKKEPSYQISRAQRVLVHVYALRDEHETLINQQALLVAQTDAFKQHKKNLEHCLAEGISSLKALWGINAALQSKTQETDTESLTSEAPSDILPAPSPRRPAALPQHVRDDFARQHRSQIAARSSADETRGARANSPVMEDEDFEEVDTAALEDERTATNSSNITLADHPKANAERVEPDPLAEPGQELDEPRPPALQNPDLTQAALAAPRQESLLGVGADGRESPARILDLLGGRDKLIIQEPPPAPKPEEAPPKQEEAPPEAAAAAAPEQEAPPPKSKKSLKKEAAQRAREAAQQFTPP